MGDSSARPGQGQGVTGFQSPADDYIEAGLSVDELLLVGKPFIFPVVCEHSEIEGLYPGDIMFVSRAKEPWHGCLAVMVIDGTFALRRLSQRGSVWTMATDTTGCVEQLVTEQIERWGVLRGIVRIFKVGAKIVQ